MPKRDQTYMDQQRTAIARAALKALLEKGVYGTSLRDICRTAGVSTGALYTHFPSKSEIIVAACSLDHEDWEDTAPASDWSAYLALVSAEAWSGSDSRSIRRARLSFQFVAELAMMDQNPPGLSAIYLTYTNNISRSLKNLHDLGEITLPLGLDVTVEVHMMLIAGAAYRIASDRDLDPRNVTIALQKSLSVSAGYSLND